MDYTPDTTAQADKEIEIESLLANFGEGGPRLTSVQIKQLINGFVSLQPPLKPPTLMTFTVMANLGRGGAESRKPGNITLNWRRLFELVPDVTPCKH